MDTLLPRNSKGFPWKSDPGFALECVRREAQPDLSLQACLEGPGIELVPRRLTVSGSSGAALKPPASKYA